MVGKNSTCVIVRGLLGIVLSVNFVLLPKQSAPASSYTVNSIADTNDGLCNAASCTLREAIIQANSTAAADTITFSLGGIIALNASLPSISSAGGALTIDASSDTVSVNGGESKRPFTVQSGANLTLKNLNVVRGYAATGNGGGVLNNGTLTVTGGTFSYNEAETSGGAIANAGTLSVTGTTFLFNRVDWVSGGAIYNMEGAEATITSCTFLFGWAELGGAIHNKGDLTINTSLLSLNTGASQGGGAIANAGSATINSSTLNYNISTMKGGALHAFGSASITTVQNSSISFNEANYGGGVILEDFGDLYIVDSDVLHNEAFLDGGGIYAFDGTVLSIVGTTIASNSAGHYGGGVFMGEGLYNVPVIERNTFYDNFAGSRGGGVYSSNNNDREIVNSTFIANRSTNLGGGLFSYNDILVTGSLLVLNCTFSGNESASGGAIRMIPLSTILKNTILNNSPAGGNCACQTYPCSVSDGGNNIDSGTTCGFGATKGSMSSTNPLLGVLRDNGGSTQTMVLLEGSPAINGVDWNQPNDCPDTDQRGYPRPYGTFCDIGAFEGVYYAFMPLIRKN